MTKISYSKLECPVEGTIYNMGADGYSYDLHVRVPIVAAHGNGYNTLNDALQAMNEKADEMKQVPS